MKTGLIICFLGSVSFGMLGLISKVAERKKCNASALVLSLVGWSTLLMLARIVSSHSGFLIPFKAIGAAIAFGIIGTVAYFAFQKSIEIGKVAIGWLMMGLSTGVPAIVSIWLYKETLTGLKVTAFALALVAMLLLFWGRMIDNRRERRLSSEG